MVKQKFSDDRFSGKTEISIQYFRDEKSYFIYDFISVEMLLDLMVLLFLTSLILAHFCSTNIFFTFFNKII